MGYVALIIMSPWGVEGHVNISCWLQGIPKQLYEAAEFDGVGHGAAS